MYIHLFFTSGDFANCQLWAQFSVLHSGHLTETSYAVGGPNKGITYYLNQYMHTVITLSAYDYSNRRKNYQLLMCYLFSNPKHVCHHIASIMRSLHTKLEDISPFLQYFIGTACNETYVGHMKQHMKQHNYHNEVRSDIDLKEQKETMITFRNSLMIMKHFNNPM